MTKKLTAYQKRYGSTNIPCIDNSMDGIEGEVSSDVHMENESYFTEVIESAKQAFTYLDSGVWDFRDSLNKSDREKYITSSRGNLESAVMEIESLIDIIDQPEKLKKIDRDIMLEHLKKPV